MKSLKGSLVGLLLLATLFVAASFLSLSGHGQTQDSRKTDSTGTAKQVVKPTALIRDRTETASDSSPMNAAALQNAALSNELNWIFGSKPQHGWNLYLPLIQRFLGTSQGPESVEFATVLSSWQARSGLMTTGVLDENSWYAIVALWQAARIKDRTPATPDQLITAPATDFYDPTREEELRQVERQTYAAYKQMVAAAASDRELQRALNGPVKLAPAGDYLKIISAYRSREYQERLRRQSPNAGTAGLAINSPHFTGRALDIYVGGDPVDTQDSNRAIQVNTPVYLWLVRNAERFGFRPYFYEPWHWEYVK